MSAVLKFGGSSLFSARAFTKVSEIINGHKPSIVVLSAMHGVTNYMTNMLLLLSDVDDAARTVQKSLIVNKHVATARELLHGRYLKKYVQFVHDEVESSFEDEEGHGLMTLGERLSSYMMVYCLKSRNITTSYVDPMRIIALKDGCLLMETTSARVNAVLLPMLAKNEVIVIPGFYGKDILTDEVATLGRGGSDYTASILAGCLQSPDLFYYKVEMNPEGDAWDDRMIGIVNEDMNTIRSMTYDDMEKIDRDKVLHPKTLEPINRKKTRMWIKNTKNPLNCGTAIYGRHG
jgi:aspartate kinase